MRPDTVPARMSAANCFILSGCAVGYDRLSPYVKRGKKDRYKAAAAAAGYSLNEFMELAMDRLADEILGKE